MTDIWTQTERARFEICMSNGRRIARSDASYRDSLLLTDSDSDTESSSDSSLSSDSSEGDWKYKQKRKMKEKRKRRGQKEKRWKARARAAEKNQEKKTNDRWDMHRGDKLDEKLKEIQKIKEDLLEQKMKELRELASQVKISQAMPSAPTLTIQPYVRPLVYGMSEPLPQVIQANLIETGQQEWTATNPNVVCYNCDTRGHYESRCWKPRVPPEIRAENVQRINASRTSNSSSYSHRPQYQPRSGQQAGQAGPGVYGQQIGPQIGMPGLYRQAGQQAGQQVGMPGLYGQTGQQVGQQVGMPGLYGQAGQQVGMPGLYGQLAGQQVGMPGLYGQAGQQVGLPGFYGRQVGPLGPSGQQTQQGPSQPLSQAVIQTTQPNTGGTRQGIADVVLAEIEEGGMLSSALEEMEYADVMQWAKEKRKRAVSEGELSASL